jgi:SpoVK/Ycf46/Vps4 family AAA+-type ATPase
MKKVQEIEFDKTLYVDNEYIDKVSLWMLKIITKHDIYTKFIDEYDYTYSSHILYFLDLERYIDHKKRVLKKDKLYDALMENLKIFKNKKSFKTKNILNKNIKKISKLMKLTIHEEKILEFLILLKQYMILRDITEHLGGKIDFLYLKKVLSEILDIPIDIVHNAIKQNSKLLKSNIISIRDDNFFLVHKIKIISYSFAEKMLYTDDDISQMLKDFIIDCDKSELKLSDYKHISDDIDILVPYLKSVINTKQKGVNILLYGLPGTGKTEFVKVVAHTLKTKLFEISCIDENNKAIDGDMRVKAYKIAQTFLSNQKIVLMYDEAEDIFESSRNLFDTKRQKDKAWINKMLETNPIPTFWITNDIFSIDSAIIRRFDLTIEMPIPKKEKRAHIIKKYSNNLLHKKSIELLAENKNIAPALITRTTKVVSSIDSKDSNKAFIHILNNTLKSQGYEEIKKSTTETLPKVYNPDFINTTANLKQIIDGIKLHPNARICLYGVPGTGKSAFGKYIAKVINKPYIIKKGSDLISMWVGGTEKNIAEAFSEAKQEKSVLIFDEVDSFLADRRDAVRNWEVTQVNEMLVQMESFDGLFIATTNLMENLDRASLRRFDLKLEFKYLKDEQSWKMFLSYAKELKLKVSNRQKKELETLKYLTPGDFTTVMRQSRFRVIKDADDFVSRLTDEVLLKDENITNMMGFVSST